MFGYTMTNFISFSQIFKPEPNFNLYSALSRTILEMQMVESK